MLTTLKKEWKDQGFIDEPFEGNNDALKTAIRTLCEEKKAVILAHYYTVGEIQEVADFIGDSLALARKAADTDARVIVMCGVHFMAETCKLLSPEKQVLCPDLNAGCSLADSCKAEDLKKFRDEHPGYQVVSYVNTTAAVKALTDVVVTSGNAKKVIDSFPSDAKIIFGPDYNLGSYINSVTGRQMLLWEGGCHVHERFSVQSIVDLKKKYPEAVVMAHLECKGPVLALADVKGSTADMLRYAREHGPSQYIVATEAGILHEMQRTCPESTFIPVPPEMSVEEGDVATQSQQTQPAPNPATELAPNPATEPAPNPATEPAPKYAVQSGPASAVQLGPVSAVQSGPGRQVASCHCNECRYMKMNTLLKIYNALKYGWPEVNVDPAIAQDAVKPIQRMLELS